MSTSLSAVFNSGRNLEEVACVTFADFFIHLLNPKLRTNSSSSYENRVFLGGGGGSTVFLEPLFPQMFQ